MKTCLLAVAFSSFVFAQSPKLWYKTPAADWSQALPIGNGRLAGMVYGGPADEQIQLNEESIYAGKRMDRNNPGARKSIPDIRRLLLDGKVKEAEDLAEKNMLAIPRRQPPYEPLGDLKVHFESVDVPQNYQRALDLYDGVASVAFDSGGVHYTREVFASYPDHAIVLHLEASRAGALNFNVSLTRARLRWSLRFRIRSHSTAQRCRLRARTMRMNRKTAHNLPERFASMRMARFFLLVARIKCEMPKKRR